MASKDLGRETGTTAPERSNTAIGERRATGASGKAVPVREPSQVDPEADTSVTQKPREAESTQRPEDYKALKREEEEEAGFSYQPSEDADVEAEPTKFEEEEGKHEEDEEARLMEEAYKRYIAKRTPDKMKLQNKALHWLTSKYPSMPIAEALKAAGEMTEVLGEVNAPQKISKEQKPPEVDYGEYGEPSTVAPLSTFSARVNSVVQKAVAAQTEEMMSKVEDLVKRETLGVRRATVREKGYGAENTVRDPRMVHEEEDNEQSWSIEGQLARQLSRSGVGA